MNSLFLEKIQSTYNEQSKTFKAITDFIAKNYNSVMFFSISELSEAIGVSLGSITRYCKFIGYSGYQTMLQDLRNQLRKEMVPLKNVSNAISTPIEEEEVLRASIASNLRSLEKMYSDDLQINFDQAVETISKARNIYVIGMRSAFTAAYFCYHSLSSFMDNVHLLTQTYSDVYDHILNIDSKDVLISIGFSKYTKLTCDITEYFAMHNSSIIAVTDSDNSPLAQNAKSKLIVLDSLNGFTQAQPIVILNALAVAVGKLHPQEALDALNKKRQMLIENGVHYFNK